MLRKAERLTGEGPERRLEGEDCNSLSSTTTHRKIQLFEIFDRDTMGAVIVSAREVSA
jgi:hypothetical protein